MQVLGWFPVKTGRCVDTGLNERYDFDIQIEIKREEVPPSQLDVGSPPQLGRTSWAVTPEGGLAENPKIIFRRPQRAA